MKNFIITNANRFFFLTLLMGMSVLISAQGNSVQVGDIGWGEVDFKGFTLSTDTQVTIKGEGGYYDEWDDDLLFYGWILDSQSREVVWSLIEDNKNSRRKRRDGNFQFDEKLQLKAGDYEVYYTGMYDRDDNNWNFGDVLSEIFGSKKSKRNRRAKGELSMTVSGPSGVFKANDGRKVVDKMSKDAIVSFIRMGDDEYEKASFTLEKDVVVTIYALGEGRRSSAYDVGWIYDEINHRKVWEMEPRAGDHAGGGSKNVLIDDEITLKKGTYTVHYVTDDSHSFREWNVMPPSDPQFWGI